MIDINFGTSKPLIKIFNKIKISTEKKLYKKN